VVPQVALERLVERLDVAVRHERLGHVRPADGAAPRDLLDLLHRDPDAEPLQAGEDLPRALVARLAIAADRLEHACVRGIEAVGEEVDVHVLLGHGELDAGDDPDSGLAGPLEGDRESCDRVVIGERDDLDAVPVGQRDDLCRRKGSVGCRGVHVEIDDRGGH
jgi:hypothetical protein